MKRYKKLSINTCPIVFLYFVMAVFLIAGGCSREQGGTRGNAIDSLPAESQGEVKTPVSPDKRGDVKNSYKNSAYTMVPAQKAVFQGTTVEIPQLTLYRTQPYLDVVTVKEFEEAASRILYDRSSLSPSKLQGVNDSRVAMLPLKSGMSVCDFGAGLGNYVFSLVDKVGIGGKVYVVDLNVNTCEFVQWKVKLANTGFFELIEGEKPGREYENIVCISNTPETTGLPAESCDLIFMNEVHVFTERKANPYSLEKTARSLGDALRPGGKIYLFDPIPSGQWKEYLLNGKELEERLKRFDLKISDSRILEGDKMIFYVLERN